MSQLSANPYPNIEWRITRPPQTGDTTKRQAYVSQLSGLTGGGITGGLASGQLARQ